MTQKIITVVHEQYGTYLATNYLNLANNIVVYLSTCNGYITVLPTIYILITSQRIWIRQLYKPRTSAPFKKQGLLTGIIAIVLVVAYILYLITNSRTYSYSVLDVLIIYLTNNILLVTYELWFGTTDIHMNTTILE